MAFGEEIYSSNIWLNYNAEFQTISWDFANNVIIYILNLPIHEHFNSTLHIYITRIIKLGISKLLNETGWLNM